MTRVLVIAAVAMSIAMTTQLARPAPAAALNPGSALCDIAGLISGVIGKACTLVRHAGRIVSAGNKLLHGHVGGALAALTGSDTPRRAAAVAGLAAIAVSVVGGARYALRTTAAIVSATTRPDIGSVWFESSYWRMAAIATLLTLPFLLAAAIQAVVRADIGLLARAAFGYLPLAGLAVGVAVPVAVLLLRASDEMSSIVSSASGDAGAAFLDRVGGVAGSELLLGHSVFLALLLALATTAMTLALWLELAVRQAAVTVTVLMLPLFFAAIVWPARRIWAIRVVELLVSLILSKFAIVAVLSLGGAALGHAPIPGAAAVLTGITLVMLAAFSPWALMRLLPLHELAGAAGGGLRLGGSPMRDVGARAHAAADHAQGGEGDEAGGAGDEGSSGGGVHEVADPELAPEQDDAPAEAGGEAAGAREGAGAIAAPLPAPAGGWDPGWGPDPAVGGSPAGSTELGVWSADDAGDGRSDLDPSLRAPDYSWRTIHLSADEAASDEPLLPGEPPVDDQPPVDEPPAPPADPPAPEGEL